MKYLNEKHVGYKKSRVKNWQHSFASTMFSLLWEVLTLVISEIRIVLTPPLLVKIRDQITYLQDNVFIIQDLI